VIAVGFVIVAPRVVILCGEMGLISRPVLIPDCEERKSCSERGVFLDRGSVQGLLKKDTFTDDRHYSGRRDRLIAHGKRIFLRRR
jgi:hypothetical protein